MDQDLMESDDELMPMADDVIVRHVRAVDRPPLGKKGRRVEAQGMWMQDSRQGQEASARDRATFLSSWLTVERNL